MEMENCLSIYIFHISVNSRNVKHWPTACVHSNQNWARKMRKSDCWSERIRWWNAIWNHSSLWNIKSWRKWARNTKCHWLRPRKVPRAFLRWVRCACYSNFDIILFYPNSDRRPKISYDDRSIHCFHARFQHKTIDSCGIIAETGASNWNYQMYDATQYLSHSSFK